MVNNMLKKCCNDCDYANIYATTDFESIPNESKRKPKTDIFCNHMYVCKKYIEELDDRKES